MIRFKRYVVALASLLVVLVVGHFYVNKTASLSGITVSGDYGSLPQKRILSKSDFVQQEPESRENQSNTTQRDTENGIVINTAQPPFPKRQLVAQNVNSIVKNPPPKNTSRRVFPKITAVPVNMANAESFSGRLAGQFPLGVDVRPYMIDPYRHAVRMAKIRLLVELYGPQKMREIRQRTNGDLTLPSITAPKREIAIITYWRSGSSFLGDLINQYPATFYHFEPLHALTFNNAVSTPEQEEAAVAMIKHLLRCEFSDLEQYLTWVRQPNNQFLFGHNYRLWMSCRVRTRLCFDPNFLNAVCKEHPVQLVKLVRLRLTSTRKLLQENPELKVVYLVRDPRGVFSSRIGLDWCNASSDCIQTEFFCDSMRQDLVVAKQLKLEFPERFTALRYEDLAVEPELRAGQLFKFLGLPMHRHVQMFLRTNTQARGEEEIGGPYSTRRNSKSTAFKWRQKLSFEQVQDIQNNCEDVIKDMGFNLIRNETQMKTDFVWSS